ncbi:zinc ribbon domain-containing protein [Chloroflexota bacterium]
MTTAKQLNELQEIDFDIERKTNDLEQIRSKLGRDELLIATRAALDIMRKRLTDLGQQQRTAEWEINDLGEKISLIEKKLYGGSVKSPKELLSFQQELEQFRGQRATKEEELLSMMLNMEAAEQDLNLKSSELQAMEKVWRKEQRLLSKEQKEIGDALAKLQDKRELFVSQADAESIKTYEETRRIKQGRAVAMIEQGKCQGCRISLSIADLQKARSSRELAKCSNCGRILYLSQ